MVALPQLVRAAHAGPTIVVTVAAVLLARGFGGTGREQVLVGLAVLAGQLSIGWSNDAIDAERDRQVGRRDKPVATGDLSVATLWRAAGLALLGTVALSALLGVLPALVHLFGAVAWAWAYNLGLKSTAWSALPYAVAFGMLPSVAALTTTGEWAPPWLTVAGAGIGCAAHIANVLPDLGADAATGVRGLPHRIGARWSRVVAAAVLAMTVGTVLVGAGLPPVLLAIVISTSLCCLAVLLIGPPPSTLPAIMVLALVVVGIVGGRIAG